MIKKYLIKESTALAQLMFVTAFLSLIKFIVSIDPTTQAVYLLVFVSAAGFGGLLTVHKEQDYKVAKKRRKR